MFGYVPSYKANRVRLLPGKDEAILEVVADRVSALWNAADYLCRQRFIAGDKVPGYAALCAEFKEHPAYRALPADIAQETLKKLSEAWRSYWRLRGKWKQGGLKDKPGLPRYRKASDGTRPTDFIPVKCGRSYEVGSRTVAVALPADLRPRCGGRLHVPYRGLRRYQGRAGRAEIAFDRGRGRWYLRYSVEVEPNRRRAHGLEAAIDLGVRVLASVSVQDEAQAFNYLGRDVLGDWDYFGRAIAKHMRELSHRPKCQRSSRRLRRLYQRRRARLVAAWEALAKRIAATCRSMGVGCVYLGHPKEIRRDVAYGALWNGRIHGFWSFDMALRILEKHLARAGIDAVRVGERGSSSECPSCGSKEVRRRPRHLLRCLNPDCALTTIHADQAGSRNILRFQRQPDIWHGLEASPGPETRRWNRHRWADASNPSASSGAEDPTAACAA